MSLVGETPANRKDMDGMDTKRVSPKREVTGSLSVDPFKSKIRLGRTPTMTGKTSNKTGKPEKVTVVLDKGPSAHTRVRQRAQPIGTTFTEDDVPSSVLDVSGAESHTPVETVRKRRESRGTPTLSHSPEDTITKSVLQKLVIQIENLAGKMLAKHSSERSRRSGTSQDQSYSRRKDKSHSKSERETSLTEEEKTPRNRQTTRSQNQRPMEHQAMRRHPGLYLPRSASIFNPFNNLKFSGTGDRLHPVLFSRRFTQIAKFERVDAYSQLHYFAICLTGSATIWWSTLSASTIGEVLNALKDKYWSTSHQLDLSHRILIGKYDRQRDNSMSDYVAGYFQENSFLDHPLPEREFVMAMISHFPREIEQKLKVSLIKTVEQLSEALNQIEASDKRAQQRHSARQGNIDERERDEVRTRETARTYQRPEILPRREQGDKYRSNTGLTSSPPPVRKTAMPMQRQEYAKRASTKTQHETYQAKPVVRFRTDNRSKDSAKTRKTVSVTEHRDTQQTPLEKGTYRRHSVQDEVEEALVAPLSVVSSPSSSSEQRSVDDYV